MAAVWFVLRAAEFAAEAHKFQTRKDDGSAYICHPLRVAGVLRDCGVSDQTILAAALLHDVVEDTPRTIEDVRDAFGDAVADIVAEVTDDRSLSAAERKRAQLAHVDSLSPGARRVKGADMHDNLAALIKCPPPGWPLERTQGYFVWKYAIFKRGIRGKAGPCLEAKLNRLFESEVPDGAGGFAPAIPKEINHTEFLERYYASLA